MKALNDAVVAHKEQRLVAFVIFVDGDTKTVSPKLEALAEKMRSHEVCLAYLSPQDEAVGDYKVSLEPSVRNTVMIYRNRRVTSKLVNLVADEKGLATLTAGLAEITK